MEILGIDIGGTGIKGAPVDLATGTLTAERLRIPTPSPATPAAVGAAVAELARHFAWQGLIGCGFPAIIRHGQVCTAFHVDPAWLNCNAENVFQEATGCPVTVLNDADAAGYAEMRFGAGQGRAGVVLLLTLGTGIGSALFLNGQLVPNTELGHLEVRGKDAETRAAASVREKKKLSWKKWASHVDEYLQAVEKYISPDLIILGGGISKKHDKFLPRLTVTTEVLPAQLLNEAGMVGAALAAAYAHTASTPKPAPAEQAPDTEVSAERTDGPCTSC